VLRWERRWHDDGQPFVDPVDYPPLSLAMTGTHDTETLAAWWEHASADERSKALQMPALRSLADAGPHLAWSDQLRDALLTAAFNAGSDDVFMPMQDVFGWRDRINTPATVGDENWTWRLPWPIDHWPAVPDAVERAAWCLARAAAHRRLEGDRP
jgi:4-alpha-glucanotransferase